MRRLLALVPVVLLLGALRAASTPAAMALGPEATRPAATTTEDPGSLAALLGRMPSLPFGGEVLTTVGYANVAAQLAAVGVEAPRGADDDTATARWVPAVAGMMLPHTAVHMQTPDWREAFGFDAFAIEQSVEYAAPPFYVTLLRGRFDPTELRAAWEREGYRPVEVDGGTIFSVREDFEVDFQSRGGRLTLSSMNHALILGDGTLAFASTREALRLLLDVEAGRQPSFASNVGVAPLLGSVPPGLVSAVLVPGSALGGPSDPAALLLQPTPGVPDVDAIATRMAAESAERRRMPPIVTTLLGLTSGGPLPTLGADAGTSEALPPRAPEARFVVALTMVHHAAAESAASVVAERLATQQVPDAVAPSLPSGQALGGRPYAELFPERSVRVPDGEPVVVIDLSIGAETPRLILYNLLVTRSLTFLAWSL